jgi:hypothetical protein
MSDTDPTPETPVTIGDRLGWFRGDLVAKFDALALQLATQHTELLAKLDTIAADTTLAQLLSAIQAGASSGGATEATAQAILAAIGTLESYPYNYTVKELLSLLNVNIAVEPTAKPPAQNTDPGSCAGVYDYVAQATGMTLVGTFVDGGITYDAYAPNVPDLGDILTNNGTIYVATVPSPVWEFSGDDVNICLSWNWTGNDVYPYYHSLAGGFAEDIWPAPTSEPGPTPQPHGMTAIGNASYLFESSDNIKSYRFAVKTGVAIANNVWWHAHRNVRPV